MIWFERNFTHEMLCVHGISDWHCLCFYRTKICSCDPEFYLTQRNGDVIVVGCAVVTWLLRDAENRGWGIAKSKDHYSDVIMSTMAYQINSHDCLLNRLFRRRSTKTSKPRVTGLRGGNSPVTGEFPAQRASNAENVSIWWRHPVMVSHPNTTHNTVYLLLERC